jgi:hypothetical protein
MMGGFEFAIQTFIHLNYKLRNQIMFDWRTWYDFGIYSNWYEINPSIIKFGYILKRLWVLQVVRTITCQFWDSQIFATSI